MIVTRVLDVQANSRALADFFALVRERRALIAAMAWRELADRYAGQALGSAWAFLSPLLMMLTYLFAFGVIFKGRLGPVDDGSAYVAYMLAGLTPWMTLQDCLSRATLAVRGNANLVKQIVFPSEILPLRIAMTSLATLLIGLAVTIPVAIASGVWSATGLFLLLPAAIALQAIMLAGLSFWLAAMGVFARDIKDLIQFLLGVGLFLHPVLYPPANVPQWLGSIFQFSPFSHMVWCFRDALAPDGEFRTWSWVIFTVFSAIAFVTGWRAFRMLKPTFGNLL